ncbi:MAG TPA: DNA polymerase III subunit delta [Clostridiales bacterium]|jgi:DNA polymerase-3 subunit delta|nr:DNA polymerase III subunit delta [Clostridiales bacterium]
MDGMTFMKALNAGSTLGGVYYFCGEDSYSLNKGVRAIIARTNPDLRDMNATILRAPAPADVQAAAESMPFFDALRVVVVQEFDADTANALEGYIKSVPETTALVFVRPGKPPLANPLYKAINALDRAISFNPLTGTELNLFLQNRAKKNGIVLDESAANRMIAYLGSDLGALENTLLMLGAYVGFGNRVTTKAVDACVQKPSEAKVFDVMNLLWAGNKRDGMRALLALVNDPSENAMGLATMFARNVRSVLNVKQLLSLGKTETQIAQTLGMKAYPAQKSAAHAKKRSYAQLMAMMDAFIAVEWNQKQGLGKAEDSLILACQEHF